MITLKQSEAYSSLAVAGGRIVLYRPETGFAQPTASTCASAVVNPSTLALSNAQLGSCADPAVFDRSVIPTISIDDNLPAPGGGPSAVVRIAHVTSRSRGYSLGPIVMTFSAWAYGNTKPSWVYGGGDLWLYDWANRFDLMRVSATTGAVLQRLSVPQIQSPLLAFNDDGLWIAPTGESSGPLYRLAPGARRAKPVFDLGPTGFAWWLIASKHSLWLADQPRPVSKTATVWALRGPGARPVWHEAANAALRAVVEQSPIRSPSIMVGNASDGLWTAVVSRSGRQQEIVRLDPRTGKSAVVATLRPGYSPGALGTFSAALHSWSAVTLDGSLFLLEAPTECALPKPRSAGRLACTVGYSVLYRVTPG